MNAWHHRVPGFFLACLLAALAGCTPETETGAIRDGWIRHVPGDRPLAGYFVLANESDATLQLEAVTSPDFARVEMHETVELDGAMRMRPLETVSVQPEEHFAFRPRGPHLMLFDRSRDLAPGDQVDLRFRFADGPVLQARFRVQPSDYRPEGS